MIAINWFETILPAIEFEIPFKELCEGEKVPNRIKVLNYRTVLIGRRNRIYHITTDPPSDLQNEKVHLADIPSIGSYAIEHGFGLKLQSQGFNVRLFHVGGTGLKPVSKSILPSIYQSLEGISFRCFYGFDISDRQKRWGLVLSWISSQWFALDLSDPDLKNYAIGKQVVHSQEKTDTSPDSELQMRSGILESTKDDKGSILDREGDKHEIALNEWTLPARKDILLGFISKKLGPEKASEVAVRLQQDSLSLIERRINTSLAKDQLERLYQLLRENQLGSFELPLLSKPIAKINEKPLVVGD